MSSRLTVRGFGSRRRGLRHDAIERDVASEPRARRLPCAPSERSLFRPSGWRNAADSRASASRRRRVDARKDLALLGVVEVLAPQDGPERVEVHQAEADGKRVPGNEDVHHGERLFDEGLQEAAEEPDGHERRRASPGGPALAW